MYRCIKQSDGTDTHKLSLSTWKQSSFSFELCFVHILRLSVKIWKLPILAILQARAAFTTVLILSTQTEQPLFSLFPLCCALSQQEKLLGRLFGREGPRGSAAWEDASVRSAWLKGVHSMLHHQPALHFLCSTGECCWGCHLPSSAAALPLQDVAQMPNDQDGSLCLFKIKISYLSNQSHWKMLVELVKH